jgi:hypothetical protein
MKIKYFLILLGVLIFYNFASYSEIYKWIDENGRVQFSDKLPETDKEDSRVEVEEVNVTTTPYKGKSRSDSLEKTIKYLQESARKRQEKAQSEKLNKIERLAMKQRCLESRMQLAVLLEKHLPTYIDDSGKFRAKWKYDTYQGNREYLDESRRDSEIVKTKKLVKIHCIDQNISVSQDTARKIWIKSEHCASARADFKIVSKPEAMNPRSTIERHKSIVNKYCN